ncbi:hypothetical protein [Acinetobacter sp. Marseille-Q1618]|uniref:hypothetical protein n=1 Tax=Acinetobacter sp. Marseille-Q1618 TaxID=2697502 RepID=UPI00156E975E|nr:hypothetical protein [Acinetobacter sp. Marseille-Q1618]
MTTAEREAYVSIIKALYGNSIYVDESMITQEVVDILETITYEIRNCTVGLGIFTTIVNALADAIQSLIGSDVGNPFKFAEDSLKDKSKQWLQKKTAQFGAEFLKSFFKSWYNILMGNTQSKACVNSAALNWKSALAMALLGI